MTTPIKLLVLDRDGVINQDSDEYVKSVDEWIPIPGSIDAIARLSRAGFTLAVATNQSGLARGYFSEADLSAMHDKMLALVHAAGGKIDQILWCPHGPDDQCRCRKPLPGMMETILENTSAPAGSRWVVGDSLRDLEAGAAVGLTPLLVKTGKGERTLAAGKPLPAGTQVFADLSAVADQLIAP